MAGLRQGECSRQSIKELYKVLAAFNTDNGTFMRPKTSPTPFVFCPNAGNRFLFQKYAFAGGLVAVEMMQLMFARNLSSFSLVLLLESLHVNTWHHFTLKV